MDDRSTKTMHQEFRQTGYDQEEEYFYRKNRELIVALRTQLDSHRRSQEVSHSNATHWMQCPKCGSDMVEHDVVGLKAELCPSCHGVFFDHGELELLTRSHEGKRLRSILKDMLDESLKPRPSGIGQFPV